MAQLGKGYPNRLHTAGLNLIFFTAVTPVSDSDSGSGLEGAPALSVTFSNAETGSGADASSEASAFSSADLGTGTETNVLGAPILSSDSGVAVDAGSIVAAISSSQTGTFSDLGISPDSPTVSDSGLIIETQSIISTLESADKNHNIKEFYSLVIGEGVSEPALWWSHAYPFRRTLKLIAPSASVQMNHPITFSLLKTNFVNKGKMEIDYSDLRIVFYTNEIGRQVTDTSSNIDVEFKLQNVLSPDQVLDNTYYMYYGNRSPSAALSYSPIQWPISIAFDGLGVTYTRPGEFWIDGVSSVPQAKATFLFYGTKIRLISDLAHNYGIAEIQLDDGDWEDVDLYSRATLSSQSVYEKDDLSQESHIIRIRVSGRQNPASSGTSINIVRFDYLEHVQVIDLGEEIDTFAWSSSLGGV